MARGGSHYRPTGDNEHGKNVYNGMTTDGRRFVKGKEFASAVNPEGVSISELPYYHTQLIFNRSQVKKLRRSTRS